MEYIIMAGGQSTRWQNYMNTEKHLVKVNNETLIERIVRQLRENSINNISLTTKNNQYKLADVKLNEMIYTNKVYNMFYYKSLNHPITFLYGDTFYSDETMKKIVNYCDNDIVFFGTKESIVAIKVVNYNKFKKYVEELSNYDGGQVGWAIYRKINNLDINDINHKNFILVEDNNFNVNSPIDYENLLEYYNKCQKN